MQVDEVIAAVRPHLRNALIATDFDGTLAPLVADPYRSAPVPGAVEALAALSGRGAQTAVITGRDAQTAVRLGGFDDVAGLIVVGLYGVETWTGGRLQTAETPEAIERLRQRLPALVSAGDPAAWIEDKRLSLVVHARTARDPSAALAQLIEPVTALGTELGFEVHRGSDVLELRLPGFDKAGALARLADAHSAVLYVGDDLGDLPAFAEIGRLRAAGKTAYGVAVRSSGVAGVSDAADAVVDSPTDVVELFRALAGD